MPASTAFVTDSNRPQPLWQPPPTARLTASGAASEVPPLLMRPCAERPLCSTPLCSTPRADEDPAAMPRAAHRAWLQRPRSPATRKAWAAMAPATQRMGSSGLPYHTTQGAGPGGLCFPRGRGGELRDPSATEFHKMQGPKNVPPAKGAGGGGGRKIQKKIPKNVKIQKIEKLNKIEK